MKKLLFMLAVVLLPLLSRASELNPFERQCNDLAKLDVNSPVFQYFNPGGFWKDKRMATIYLAALKAGDNTKKASDELDTQDRAALVLAAIVRHDLPLMNKYYNKKISLYFINTGWSVMTFAASCNFDRGVSFLLKSGIDPNAGPGTGPFNIALVYGNNAMAHKLLAHGYRITANHKRCQSSKFIIEHSKAKLSHAIYGAVKAAKCPPPDS